MEATLALLSAIAAILAVIFGPLISIYVVNRQAHIQVLVLERKEKIKELRKKFSEFVTHLMMVNTQRNRHLINYKDATEKLEKAFQLETELSLMVLDVNNEDMKNFLFNITEARNRIFKDTDDLYDSKSWEKHYYEAAEALIKILKSEMSKLEKLK